MDNEGNAFECTVVTCTFDEPIPYFNCPPYIYTVEGPEGAAKCRIKYKGNKEDVTLNQCFYFEGNPWCETMIPPPTSISSDEADACVVNMMPFLP